MTIELIESKLRIMNPDAFHRLCDHFLFFDGDDEFDSIVPVGQVEGKQKARKGTPDTRIRRSDGSYIFIQYTTQEQYPNRKEFLDKLKEDLTNCFDHRKTKVGIGKIGLIILCFNSNIGNDEEQTLRDIAWEKRKKLELINLSTLAHKILKFHPFLAKEYLGIEIDTFQLLPVKKFIEEYEKGGIATPLSNKFLFREDETKSLEASVDSNMITVIAGKAGVGKTKLVVEALCTFTKKHRGYNAFCIKNKDQPILQDLRRNLLPKKKYLIFIDDANKSILHLRELLTFYQENQTYFKLILSVRDYVLTDIMPFLQGYSHQIINIKPFESQQINAIVQAAPFSIKHPLFVERIRQVARGNPRLAIMTAIAAKDRTLDELNNVSEIYRIYFERISADYPFLATPDYMRVLGILAFFRMIDRDDPRTTEVILPAFGLDENDFWTKLYELERHEIVDVFTDRSSARFSDQILEGYLFFRVFFVDKLLDYQIILDRFFPEYAGRIKYTAIDANNTFGFVDFGDLIKPFVFNKFSQIMDKGDNAAPFLGVFWLYLQDETLLYIKNEIERLPEEGPLILEDKISTIKFNEKTFAFAGDTTLDQDEKDEIYELITPFLHNLTADFELSLELLFDLLEKKPRLAEKVVREIKGYFNFTVMDGVHNYFREEQLSCALIERTKSANTVFKYIFLKLLPHFLKTRFETSFMEGRNINLNYVQPGPSEKFLKIRSLYWQRFNQMYAEYPLLSLFSFKAILDTFGPDFQKEVRTADWAFIEAIFDRHFNYENFKDVYAINEFVGHGARMGLTKNTYAETQKKAQTTEYRNFMALDWNLLRNRERYPNTGQSPSEWHKWFEEQKKTEIIKTFNHKDLNGYKATFTFINQCSELQVWERYNIGQASQLLFNAAVEKGIDVLELISFLIRLSNFNQFFSFERLFNYLRDLAPSAVIPVGNLLKQGDYPNRPYVLLAYYNTLAEKYIDQERTQEYLDLISNFTGWVVFYFDNVESYLKVDKLFLLKALTVLIPRAKSGACDIRLNDGFLENHAKHIRNTGIMEKVYLQMIRNDLHYDHDGSELLVILNRRPSFYLALLEYLADDRPMNRSDHEKIGMVWHLENPFKLIEKAVNFLSFHKRYHYHAENLLADLFDNKNKSDNFRERRLEFLKEYIHKNSGNIKRMGAIFKASATKMPEHLSEIVPVFLKANRRFDHFTKIGWSDRAITVMSGDAIAAEINEQAWQRLKVLVDEMKPASDYLEHKVFINKQIAFSKKDAQWERKRNFLRHDY